MNKSDFDKWYGQPIQLLLDQDRDDYLIAALMLCLPVVEAILRSKTGDNASGFMSRPSAQQEFRSFLTNDGLSSSSVDLNLTDWWSVFRNGFLHRLDFADQSDKGRPLPPGWIDHTYAFAAGLDTRGVVCNPRKICTEVMSKVSNDPSLLQSIDAPNVGTVKEDTSSGQITQTFFDPATSSSDLILNASSALTSSLTSKP